MWFLRIEDKSTLFHTLMKMDKESYSFKGELHSDPNADDPYNVSLFSFSPI